MSEYRDQIGFSLSALDLLLHHMLRAYERASDPGEEKILSNCLPMLANLRDALERLGADE